ncbi:hypothetical protein TYRP_009209, partial [Tyrophagus putrescentiae]
FGQRLTLTTLGHCERPPTRAPLAPLVRPESVDVHSAQVSSDLAALGCALLLFSTILVKLNQLSNGSPWRHLAHQKRPPTRTSLAPLAKPSSAGILLLGPCSLRSQDPRRRTLTSAKSRQTSQPWAGHCFPRNNGASSAAQGKNGSDNAQPNTFFMNIIATPKSKFEKARFTLTTLGHCELLPIQAPLALLARTESVDVHSVQVLSDLVVLGCALPLLTK